MDECKTCASCHESRPLAEFNKDRNRFDGLFPYCRVCKAASDRRSHARHKVRRNADRRMAYATDPAYKRQEKERALAAYYADQEAGKRRALEWAAANPERRLEIRTASFRKAWEADPERFREAWRKRQAAIRRGCKVYAVTVDQIAAKVAYWGGKCWMCGGPYDSIDHVKPLAKGGAHCLANLRPACTPCNTRKRDRWPYVPVAA